MTAASAWSVTTVCFEEPLELHVAGRLDKDSSGAPGPLRVGFLRKSGDDVSKRTLRWVLPMCAVSAISEHRARPPSDRASAQRRTRGLSLSLSREREAREDARVSLHVSVGVPTCLISVFVTRISATVLSTFPLERASYTHVLSKPPTIPIIATPQVETGGLLLLTCDGAVARRVVGAHSEIRKCYEVETSEEVFESQLERLNAVMRLDGRDLRPMRVARVRGGGRRRLTFALTEGRNRQIRRCCEKLGLTVLELKRTSVGGCELADLPEGRWRELRADELESLRAGESASSRAAHRAQAQLRLDSRGVGGRTTTGGRSFSTRSHRGAADARARGPRLSTDEDDEDEDEVALGERRQPSLQQHWMVSKVLWLDEGRRVVVLGDGDMSFSNALSRALVERGFEASRFLATTFPSELEVLAQYGARSEAALRELRGRGCDARFAVDATSRSEAALREASLYVWNFPSEQLKTTQRKEQNRKMMRAFLANVAHHAQHEPVHVWITLFGNQWKQWELDPTKWRDHLHLKNRLTLIDERAFDHEGLYSRNFASNRRQETTYLLRVSPG